MEEREELARELGQFGHRETDDAPPTNLGPTLPEPRRRLSTFRASPPNDRAPNSLRVDASRFACRCGLLIRRARAEEAFSTSITIRGHKFEPSELHVPAGKRILLAVIKMPGVTPTAL